MALTADQIKIGPIDPPPEVKSSLQLIRESVSVPSDVKVINNLKYSVIPQDPFKVKRKRTIQELLLINQIKQNDNDNVNGIEDQSVDNLNLNQIREMARLEQELEELRLYQSALRGHVGREHVPPDWTIERVVNGSFNKFRANLDGVEVDDVYQGDTPIFVVDRKVNISIDDVRNRVFNSDDSKFMSVDEARLYFRDRLIKEKQIAEAAIEAENEKIKLEIEAEVLKMAKEKLDRDLKLKTEYKDREAKLKELMEERDRVEADLQRSIFDTKQNINQLNLEAAKKAEEDILNQFKGPQRAHFVKKIKNAVSKQSKLIEYKQSAFTSDMLNSSKD